MGRFLLMSIAHSYVVESVSPAKVSMWAVGWWVDLSTCNMAGDDGDDEGSDTEREESAEVRVRRGRTGRLGRVRVNRRTLPRLVMSKR